LLALVVAPVSDANAAPAACYSTNYNGVFSIANAIGSASITVNMLTTTLNSKLVSTTQKITLANAVDLLQAAIADMYSANNAAFTVTGEAACTQMEAYINAAESLAGNGVATANSLVLGGATSAALETAINNALNYWGSITTVQLNNALSAIETNSNVGGGTEPPINN
jgi:hypothetical protein